MACSVVDNELVLKLFISSRTTHYARNHVQFTELTDEQWHYLRPFLPPQPRVERKRADDRQIINAILFAPSSSPAVAGVTCPAAAAPPSRPWRRLRWWSAEGVWDRIVEELR